MTQSKRFRTLIREEEVRGRRCVRDDGKALRLACAWLAANDGWLLVLEDLPAARIAMAV